MEPNLKPPSYASFYTCSLWVSVHAPSIGNRLQTHRGGARQNQLGVAVFLLLTFLESERKRQSKEGGSSKVLCGIYGYSARTFQILSECFLILGCLIQLFKPKI